MTENAYLVGLRLSGRKVVVVGGGTVAQRRLPLLLANGADVHVITRAATPAVEATSGITLELRDYRDGDLDGAWYAIAATDDPAVNAAVVAGSKRSVPATFGGSESASPNLINIVAASFPHPIPASARAAALIKSS